MKYYNLKTSVTLGSSVQLEDLIAVARFGATVEFNEEYKSRVMRSRELVERWTAEDKAMYGVTTGFGSLCSKVICSEDAEILQHNIVNSHACSVGAPLTEEEVRAIMFMVLQNIGQGFSGARLEVLEQYRQFLNCGLTPWAPRDGSVGYLSPEAHMARVIEGNGKAYYQGTLMTASQALEAAGLKPINLASKEGLALVSGTTSTTALGSLALYDLMKASACADIVGALSFETVKGQFPCIDERVMSVRPHSAQADTASNLRSILADSEFLKSHQGDHLQDPLSIRCIPQLHGSSKQVLRDALEVIEIEMNSSCDNPIVWPGEDAAVLSACNADSSYVGMQMDSAAIAATGLAKISERRNNLMIDSNLSGYPSFMIANPGLNSGLMIPQYTQAGLLNDMRILSMPATVDNTSTCGNQEDYVSMGYNASKKARQLSEKLEYILAIELLASYESTSFTKGEAPRCETAATVYEELAKIIPLFEQDIFLYDGIEFIRDLIHSGRLIEIVQNIVPDFK